VKSTAGAVGLAFALSGCGFEEWSFDVQGATLDDASARVEAGPDVPMAAHCLSDENCVRPAPRCDMQSGKCVGCLVDGDCTQSLTPRCDVHVKSCVVCIDDRDCTAPFLGHCNPFHTECEECVSSSDCPSGGPGTVPVCDVKNCFFSCADAGGICPVGDQCNPLRGGGRCAQCFGDSDCADASSGSRCVNGRCNEGLPFSGRPVVDGGGIPDLGDAAGEASLDAPSDAAPETSSRGDAMGGSD
jgi:hypothetical protein